MTNNIFWTFQDASFDIDTEIPNLGVSFKCGDYIVQKYATAGAFICFIM